MTRNEMFGRYRAQLLEHPKSQDTAVHDRRMVDEQQIGQPQRAGQLVVDGEIVVRVSHWPCVQADATATEIEEQLVLDQQRRLYYFAALRASPRSRLSVLE